MDASEITVLLRRWAAGDDHAREEVWPELYPEMKIIARGVLRARGGQVGQVATTSLVHDAALRMLDLEIDWQSRRHFYALTAKVMRYELVDEARRRASQKRGAGHQQERYEVAEMADPEAKAPHEIIAVHQALYRLAQVNARQERLVELRYFGGLSVEESADVLGVSVPTAVRDWRAVRVWLRGQLQATA